MACTGYQIAALALHRRALKEPAAAAIFVGFGYCFLRVTMAVHAEEANERTGAVEAGGNPPFTVPLPPGPAGWHSSPAPRGRIPGVTA